MARLKQTATKPNKKKVNGTPKKRKRIIEGLEPISSPEPSQGRTTRRSTASKQPTESAQAIEDEVHTGRFKSYLYRKKYINTFGTRELCEGRNVDFESLDATNADFIRTWFTRQGWDKLVESTDKVYPDVVRLFYTHFDNTNEEKGVIYSWVKGKEIKLDEFTLGEILGLQTEGLHDLPLKKWSTVEGFDSRKAIKLVLMDEECERTKKPDVDELPLPTRLLELIVQRTFVGRNGRLSSLTFLDMLVLYCLLSGEKMNMPRMMIDYMIAAQKDKKGGFLPYGMWLTKVFKHFNVSLKDEAVDKSVIVPFNDKTITNALAYDYNEELGMWIKKNVKRAPKRKAPANPPELQDDEGHGTAVAARALEEVLVESLVVQEMLRRLHPTVFTGEAMHSIRDAARLRLNRLRNDEDMDVESGCSAYSDGNRKESGQEEQDDNLEGETISGNFGFDPTMD